MKQLAVVVALVALLMAVARVEPVKQILPDDFSQDFPDHRAHHEQLLHNLGQKPLRDYPGDVVRLWWVGEGRKQLLVVEPTGLTEVEYETDGYKPRVVKQARARRTVYPEHWAGIEKHTFASEMWTMEIGPGLGPFTVGGRTWILELKRAEQYRIVEKIDPLPPAFDRAKEAVRNYLIPAAPGYCTPKSRYCTPPSVRF